MKFKSITCAVALTFVLGGATVGFTQTAGPVARYTAKTINTSSSGDTVRFDLLRWSTDAERDQLFSAVSSTGDSAIGGVLSRAATIGYIWTSESAGYSLKYAYRLPAADGGERIVFATDRLLGSFEPQRWKLSGSAQPMDYSFTVVELRINKLGVGEGKTSLTSKVVADKDAKSIALENYAAATVLFQGVKK